jgi:hypothetical protein
MEYQHKFNKPMMKAPYKLMQLIGTQNSGKERLTAKVRTLMDDSTWRFSHTLSLPPLAQKTKIFESSILVERVLP